LAEPITGGPCERQQGTLQSCDAAGNFWAFHTMRFIFSLIALSLLLTSCSRNDARMQRELKGTWVTDFPDEVHGALIHSTCVIQADGSYFGRLDGYTNGNVVTLEGKIYVKDGVMVNTCTKHSDARAMVPFVRHDRIVRIDDHELVMRPEITLDDKDVIFRKVEK
jgi:hypothetical protein